MRAFISPPYYYCADSSLGQLFLGVFSGPVEGIIIIVAIYAITGYYGKYITCPLLHSATILIVTCIGPSYWDTGILTASGVDRLFPGLLKTLPNVPLNEAFMWFGALMLLFNIATRFALPPIANLVVY